MVKKYVSMLMVVTLVLSFSICVYADNTYTVKNGDVLWKIAEKTI